MQTMQWKRSLSQLCSNHSNKVYQIKKNFDCNSKMVVYLIQRRICGKQCNSSTKTTFRAGANNYKSTHRDFRKEQNLLNRARNQKRFHKHYLQSSHNGISENIKNEKIIMAKILIKIIIAIVIMTIKTVKVGNRMNIYKR